MAYVSVPKDLTKVKNKVAFNLTKRQLICIGIGAAMGIPCYFLFRNALGINNAAGSPETCRTIYRGKATECRENQTKRRKRRDTENQISKKKGGYELMSKVTFEEDELTVVALFHENTRKDTIDILKDTLEALEEAKEDPLEDDLLETIASAISKLQMIEDKYYYSLDLNRYLNNLEDDAYEE